MEGLWISIIIILVTIAVWFQHFHYHAKKKRENKKNIKAAYEEGYNDGLEEKPKKER